MWLKREQKINMTGTEKKRAITTDMKDQNNYNLLYANSMKINLKI